MGFESFLGNAQAVAAVREMLSTDRVPGALLFTGLEGVGKKTLAMMMAKAMVCERGPQDFCDECPRCKKADQFFAAAREDLARRREIKESARRVEGLVYFDLQLIEPITKFILTEQIRQVRTIAYTRPFELPRRIFIIDSAQDIHWQAVDLLLKVLEEPPESTNFILICPNAYELRSTIRSRCLKIPFQPVEEPLIKELLAKRTQLSDRHRDLAARVAAGSVARALEFSPSDYEARRQPWVSYLESIARSGAPGAKADWQPLLESARALADNRADFEGMLKVGYALLSDLMHVLLQPAGSVIVNVDLAARLPAWARALTLSGIQKLKSGLDEAYRLQVRNVNAQLGFETLGIDMIAGAGRRP
jgi:DNA polymerase-3 subunit delta'